MNFRRPRHQYISELLNAFDAAYLEENRIFFGRGTRIAMELNEYRESVDIDFFCAGPQAYAAARRVVTSNSFGSLLREGQDMPLHREIRTDRDAIRAFVGGAEPVKLEFIHFDGIGIEQDLAQQLFPVPCVDQTTCFTTKLLANADRYSMTNKDIFDLCMMRREWGAVPEDAWECAVYQYGETPILRGLENALMPMIGSPVKSAGEASRTLCMENQLAQALIETIAPLLLEEARDRLNLAPSSKGPSPDC